MNDNPPGEAPVAVVDVIRTAIKVGAYHPRERLVEDELASKYGVKRSAVRAALLELTSEGLVERLPNRGARVRRVSTEEAIEITEVRLSLQAMCAAKAATGGTDEDREWLRQEIARLAVAVGHNDSDEYVAANEAIFSRIRQMGGQLTANRLIEQLQNQNVTKRYPYMLPERRFSSLHEFEAIVDAVLARDAQAAYDATIMHREKVVEALQSIRDSERQQAP